MITVSTEQIATTNNPPAINKPSFSKLSSKQQSVFYIIAQPNQSASWQANKLLILALGLPSAMIAATFSLAGAWLLLPFAGLEITGIGAALYIVCKKLQHRHVLVFSNHQLIVEKGCYQPQQIWRFAIDTLSISVERQTHPWDALKIHLYGSTPGGQYQQVSVGEFLNKQDSLQLLQILRQQGLCLRNDSSFIEMDI